MLGTGGAGLQNPSGQHQLKEMINNSSNNKRMFAKMGSDIIQGTSVELSNGKGDSNVLKPHQNNFMGNNGDAKMYASSDQKVKYQSNGENQV